MRDLLLRIEDLGWSIRCNYSLWLHGPYGLAKVIEKIPFRFIIKYLRKYGATVGDNCRFERGINLHRPLAKPPFENLIIGNNVYLGHNIIIDLTQKVVIEDDVIIASGCKIWTHASYYERNNTKKNIYKEKFGEVNIKKSALIYSDVIISQGTTIGSNSKIGANSLVNKNVDNGDFFGGVPAVKIE